MSSVKVDNNNPEKVNLSTHNHARAEVLRFCVVSQESVDILDMNQSSMVH